MYYSLIDVMILGLTDLAIFFGILFFALPLMLLGIEMIYLICWLVWTLIGSGKRRNE